MEYFQVSYRKKNTSPGGFNFGKDFLYCVCLVTGREKKTKKSCEVSCNNWEVDKAVDQAIVDRKADGWSTEA